MSKITPDLIDEKLKHLTLEQIDRLIKRYYAGEKTSDLIEEYKIDVRPNYLYKLFPPIIEDDICEYCEIHLLRERPSKSSLAYSSRDEAKCPICGHINNVNCKCKQCLEKAEARRKKEEELKRKQIHQVYDLSKRKQVEFSELTLRDRLYLAALLRDGLDESASIITPLKGYKDHLVPKGLLNEFFSTLWTKNIIVVHPDSPVNAFVEDEDFPNTFYIYEVFYHLNLTEFSSDPKSSIESLLYPDSLDFFVEPEQCLELWKEIALEECKEYLLYNMNKVGFNFTIGEKTISVLNDLLNYFSTSQVFAIIYSCVSNAVRYYHESRVPKKQAANSVIGRCQRYGERAIAENWNVSKFKRNYNLPQTTLSSVLYNRILRIGNNGFDEKPSIESLNKAIEMYLEDGNK